MMTNKIARGKRASKQRGIKTSLKVLALCGFFAGSGLMQSCEKDILTGQPEWLGNSIYERLQGGITTSDGQNRSFNTTLRLIDDLGYTEVLSKTGSRTLFVASDADYEKWFKNNNWGVSKYEDLTDVQKKQLFNGTMINDAYLISLMSNISGDPPKEGQCMRRETATSIYDYVPTLKSSDMPRIDFTDEEMPGASEEPINMFWKRFTNEQKDIRIFKDDSPTPMIHFLPDFMKKNNITSEDLMVISNGASNSNEDAWVNGMKVISTEQTCKNGYIYVVDGVMGLNKSMAEIIHEDAELSTWAKILDRWSCPSPVSKSVQDNFRRLYNTEDSVFSLRYVNTSNKREFLAPNNDEEISKKVAPYALKFDPGWNAYSVDNNQVDMHYDAGVMIVPDNQAVQEWFTSGGGKSLMERFGSIDKIPYSTLVSLMNVNMLESFTASVPSKFNSILDDAQRTLGITPKNVKRCYMGCNGVVYVVDKVFAPADYSSVMFPARIQNNTGSFGAIDLALTGYSTGSFDTSKDFSPYLTAMDSYFSLILPYNVVPSVYDEGDNTKKVIRFLDPATSGMTKQLYMEFFVNKGMKARKYATTVAPDGTMTIDLTTMKDITNTGVISNRMYDYIDNATILEPIVAGKEFYKTKAGSAIRAYYEGGQLCLQGGYQMETGEVIRVSEDSKYPMSNGITYGVLDGKDATAPLLSLPLTSSKSVYQVLKSEAEAGRDTLFYNLIFADESGNDQIEGMTSALPITKDGSYYCINPANNKNINIFDNYNYTVYVPTDASIQKMIDDGYLPTWDDYYNATTEARKKVIADRIHNFVRYHIQDNAVYVKGDELVGDDGKGQNFESSKLNPKTNRFYSMKVYAKGDELTITDMLHQTRNVVKGAYYNKMCRECWINQNITDARLLTVNAEINASSYIVLHKIDDVLLYDQSQQTKWEDEAREAERNSAP